MSAFTQLFDLASGRPLPEEADGPARRMQLVLRASAVSMLFAAVFGLAAGSTDAALAVANVYKLPMVIALSSLCAVPVGLLMWKLSDAPNRASDLLIGVATGNLTATLVLAALSPVVALYYHTSGSMGGPLAMGVIFLAVALGLFNVARSVQQRRPDNVRRGQIALPLAAIMAVQLASLVQFIHVASPILPEVTVFDGGVDAMVGR